MNNLREHIVGKLVIGGFAVDEDETGAIIAWVRGGVPEDGQLVVQIAESRCKITENSGAFAGKKKRQYLEMNLNQWAAQFQQRDEAV